MPSRPSLIRVVRDLVYERSSGRCEKCGRSLPRARFECHHRKLRSQGGDWSITNLLALHDECHNAGYTTGVHAHPRESYERGYLVRSAFDPAETPVFLFGKRWVLLTATGKYERAKEPNHAE